MTYELIKLFIIGWVVMGIGLGLGIMTTLGGIIGIVGVLIWGVPVLIWIEGCD